MRSTATTLRRVIHTAAVLAICLLGSNGALGASYNDSTLDGDILPTFPHLDIASVEVSNTTAHISFKINLVGSPTVTTWGEYQIGIDSILGGATNVLGGIVPNGRPISMASGMDYYIRSWHTGAELYRWDSGGSFWAGDFQTWNPPSDVQVPSKTISSVTLTTTLSSLGLSNGDTIAFDVWSSGGTATDSAVDALANPLATAAGNDWVSPYDTGANVFYYTVVPEPSTLVLGLVAFAATIGRRKQR